MRPISVSLKLTAADANGICTTQTAAAAADLSLGGALYHADNTAYFGTDSRVRITSAGDDTGITFTVYGTDAYGPVSETVTGVSGSTVDTVTYFRTVERIIASGASAGNVSAGTSGDADALTTAAAVTATGQLTRNGVAYRSAKMSGTAILVPAQVVYLYSAGDLSGIEFTVYGRDADGVEMSEAISGPNAANTYGTKLFSEVIAVYANAAVATNVTVGDKGNVDSICEAQQLTGAGYLVFNGTGCDLAARHISITSASADESGVTFTVRGLDRKGLYMTEAIVGPGAGLTVKGSKNFSVVQAIRVSGALGGNVTVGSADEAETQLIPVDFYNTTTTYQVRRSADMDNSTEQMVSYTRDEILLPSSKTEYTADYANMTSDWLVADEAQTLFGPVTGFRLRVRSHTIGTLDMRIIAPLRG